jgi:Astacin (Peptidase family M12A)
MNDLEKYICVKFIPVPPINEDEEEPTETEPDYIVISTGKGCVSEKGRIGGPQSVTLENPKCMKRGVVMHELIHTLGFTHMQNHNARDEFITVHFENVVKGKENNFRRASAEKWTNFNTDYDYNSIMHYSKYAFSKNPNDKSMITMEPKDPKYLNVIGQRQGLSEGDVTRLRR